jgi:hypothetical protein
VIGEVQSRLKLLLQGARGFGDSGGPIAAEAAPTGCER